MEKSENTLVYKCTGRAGKCKKTYCVHFPLDHKPVANGHCPAGACNEFPMTQCIYEEASESDLIELRGYNKSREDNNRTRHEYAILYYEGREGRLIVDDTPKD
jgi:hypothetical protein